ncbi:DUF1543 domain-containing protein [Flavobacterium psychrotolerans]|nr:DUF1543 domain-containing protein [Flavobacterium psychrotolerans]
MKLYMILLGCRPKGRFTEQHDIFFGIGNSLAELIPEMKASWPEAKGKIHVDSWREVTAVTNHKIEIVPRNTAPANSTQLFFINLGGYKENEFEEYHYKILAVGDTLAEASKKAKTTSFYKHFGFKGATSHIDDKYGVDVDEIYSVKDILSLNLKEKYELKISKSDIILEEDLLHIGYLKLEKL